LIDLELCALKLTNFDCSHNRLIRLPLNLREMNSLIELNVDHNPLETPPASVRRKMKSFFDNNIDEF
jgi:Leucine-rich repeat (LRR) protein